MFATQNAFCLAKSNFALAMPMGSMYARMQIANNYR